MSRPKWWLSRRLADCQVFLQEETSPSQADALWQVASPLSWYCHDEGSPVDGASAFLRNRRPSRTRPTLTKVATA